MTVIKKNNGNKFMLVKISFTTGDIHLFRYIIPRKLNGGPGIPKAYVNQIHLSPFFGASEKHRAITSGGARQTYQ